MITRLDWLAAAWHRLACGDIRGSQYCLARARGERPSWSPMP